MPADLVRGRLDLLLLASGPSHGVWADRELRRRSGGFLNLPEGSIYPALHQLEEASPLDTKNSTKNCPFRHDAASIPQYAGQVRMTKGRSIGNNQQQQGASKGTESPPGLTVREFLDGWLRHVADTRRPTTANSYAGMIRRYVIPVIGQTELKDLRREHVDAVLTGAKDRLNPNTTRLLRAVLGIALHRAERWEIMGARNVVRLTDPPRVEPRELRLLRASEARRFISVASRDRLAVVYVLFLFCGLRRGEVLALRWCDVDVDKREIHVRNTLHEEAGGTFRIGEAKSMSARRSIAISVTVASSLAEHRERQIAELRAIGPSGVSCAGDWGLVVTSHRGKPLSKSTLRGNFRRLLKTAGLPVIRIHDLRHSCASILLAEGVAAHTVANFLGHSEVKTTLNIYGHVARSQTQDAALAMDRTLGSEYAAQESFNWHQAVTFGGA